MIGSVAAVPMVGAPEVEIDGVEVGGVAVALLRDGAWQL
jgi:hypothetical protein